MPNGRVAYLGYHTEGGGNTMVFACSRGKARALVVNELDYEFTDSLVSVVRFPKADHLAKNRTRPTMSDFRESGFSSEDGQICDECRLGDPSDGDEIQWRVCRDCGRCGLCGCDSVCRS